MASRRLCVDPAADQGGEIAPSYLLTLRRAWGEAILAAFIDLPLFEWEKRSAPSLHAISEDQKP